MVSGPLSATFSLLAQTSISATDCWQSALSKKKFMKNKFYIFMTNKTFSIIFFLLLTVTTLGTKIKVITKKHKMPLLPLAEQ